MPKTKSKFSREAEELLQERYFRTLIKKSTDCILLSDLHGNYSYASPSTSQVLGYTPEEFIKLNGFEIIHPDDLPRIGEAFKKLISADEASLTEEFRFRHKDGSWQWVEATATNFLSDPGIQAIVSNVRNITDRKKYQEELKESELRFRSLADTAPMYIAMADEKGNAVYFNKPWLEYTGNTLEDMLGLGWLRTLHPEDAPKFERDFKHAFDTQTTINEQYRFRRADGTYRWMLAVGAPRFTPDRRFIGYFGTYTDFNDVKEAQLAVQESEKKFRQLAETIPHIVYSSNAEGEAEYYNHHWYEYTGLPSTMHIIDWSPYVHHEDVQNLFKKWNQAKKKGEYFEAEYRLKRHDGAYRWHMARSSPIRNQNGKIIRWFGTATDIHERIELENNLMYLSKASTVLSASLDYKKTLNSIATLAVPEIADWCAIEILDGKGGLEQVAISHKDPAKVKWARELRKADPVDLQAPTGVPNVIRTGKSELYPQITDEMLQKRAKSEKHLKLLREIGFTSAMIVPLSQENKCMGAITFVSTEMKRKYRKADLAMAEELAHRASMALENAGLYRNIQKAVTLRDNFISVASHELKTPVTSVKIFTQVLQKHSEQIGDQQAIKHLAKMDKQLNKLIELIYDLLNVSKIQAGRMEFAQKLFDFDESIKDIVGVLQAGELKHNLIVEGKTNKKIYADEDRIGQVVSNLVSNAIKYSPNADKVIIRLSADEEHVNVCVEDFGIGLANEHTNRIFERFYRVFDTTDKTFPGLGIGLYISSEIIKRHHGKLWVESDTGKGSKFYFSLPLKKHKKAKGIQVL